MSDGLTGKSVYVGSDPILGGVFDRITHELANRGIEIRRQAAPGVLEPDALDCEVLCINSRTPVTGADLARATKLRGIVYVSNGTDSCDLDTARALSIPVRNGATRENVTGMAEATVMLMAALLLELPRKQETLATGVVPLSAFAIGSRMLAGSTVGFLGFGRIARAAAQRLAGWDTSRIMSHTRSPRARAWPGVDFVSINELFGESDVVSINVPLTQHTKHLVDASLLSRMKPTAYLVSASRGGIVRERDLIRALRSRTIAGAALDVFETEPLPPDHPLRGLDNVILTPHAVGHTREMFQSLVSNAVNNVVDLCKGPRKEDR